MGGGGGGGGGERVCVFSDYLQVASTICFSVQI